MFKPRIIARLDIKGENLIKSINLEGLRKIGNPNEKAVKYFKDGADELLFIDCVASLYGRNNILDVIKKAAENTFIPITVGGGIRSLEDVRNILNSGADKICINTAAIKNPKIITDLSKKFGSQCVVVSIEAKKIFNNNWEVYTHNGRERTGLEVLTWVKKSIKMGAGEILLTSIDKEGTGKGFDLDLISKVSKACSVPLIVSGGFGELSHMQELLKKTHVDGIAVAKVLHYNKYKIKDIKKKL